MTGESVGVVGLGKMGSRMAGRLVRANFQVLGVDPSEPCRQVAQELGVSVVDSVARLCHESETILLSLPTAKQVSAVIEGREGILKLARRGTLVIDTSTSEPAVTRRLAAELSAVGHGLLDAPVSGGPAGAAAGTLVMVVGGAEEHLERARAVLSVLAAKIVHMGPSGSGHIAKLINNLLCAAHLLTMAEAVALGRAAGLDAARLLDGINAGSGRSAVSEVNYPRWVLNGKFDSGFTMKLMRKDVRLAMDLIESLNANLPMASLSSSMWSASGPLLADDEDFNCITKVVAMAASR